MAAEETIFATLSGNAGVAAIVSNRIFPSVRPQDSIVPCIVYHREATQVIQTIHGATALTIATIAVRAVAATMATADAISDAVDTALAVHMHDDRTSAYDPDADVFISTTTHLVRD
ncbi:MAG: DUF3168 domain-containing protein [Hyphomonadaceae bacterium]